MITYKVHTQWKISLKKITVHLIFKILKNWTFQFINLTMNDSVNVHKAYISEVKIHLTLAIILVLPLIDLSMNSWDNWEFSVTHIFAHHQDGIRKYFSIISEMSKDYFNRCKYIKASKYGAYAKGTAMGGIISMIIVLLLIAAQLIHYHMKFYY